MGVEEEIKKVFAERLFVKEEKISRDSKIMGDLGADSLDALEIIMDLEEKYEVKVPDEEAEKMETFGDVVDYVVDHQN